MELKLARESATQAAVVYCDGQRSHTFDPSALVPGPSQEPPKDPVTHGQALFAALFPPDSLAARTLDAGPKRILLVATDPALEAIPWEYLCGPDDFLVLEYPFVRGLPAERRVPPPSLEEGLHVVGVPSNPLDPTVPPLEIEAEWLRLKEAAQAVSAG